MLLSYLMLEIYISVPAAHFVEPWGQNIDKKYDECILYFLRRVKFADINKLAVYYAAHLALYFTLCGILNQPMT